ncbi:hypothetical protein JHK85_000517 [Glycine max]|nr:hypothetical protein JHK85_000517 [Glycine max]
MLGSYGLDVNASIRDHVVEVADGSEDNNDSGNSGDVGEMVRAFGVCELPYNGRDNKLFYPGSLTWIPVDEDHNLLLHINDDTLRNLTLIEIEQLLHINQRSLKDYPTMPYPQDINLTSYLQNNLIRYPIVRPPAIMQFRVAFHND